jgi:hypothetical protein
MDTDSAHFLLKHEKFEDNVDENLRKQFIDLNLTQPDFLPYCVTIIPNL